MTINLKMLRQMVPYASMNNVSAFLYPLNEAMQQYHINTPKRIAAFIAQITHESGSFKYVKEIASGQAYDTGKLAEKLGNTPQADGDGQKYKGRGLIQITGTTNYKAVGEALGIDCISSPELLEQPEYAAKSAAWYWYSRGLNALADTDEFKKITVKINGGLNGYNDRLKHWQRCKKVMGV